MPTCRYSKNNSISGHHSRSKPRVLVPGGCQKEILNNTNRKRQTNRPFCWYTFLIFTDFMIGCNDF